MKTHTFKNYLKLGIFLFGISFLLTNCEQDDVPNSTSKIKSKFQLQKLKYEQIKSNTVIVAEIDKLVSKTKDNLNFTREVHNNQYGFTVHTEQVIFLTDNQTGYHSYNFYITRDSTTNSTLENLVLSSNNIGTYDTYIINYGFTAQEYPNLTEEELSSINKTISTIDFDTSVFNENDLSQKVQFTTTDNNGSIWGYDCDETLVNINCSNCDPWYVWDLTNCGWIPLGGGSFGDDDLGIPNTNVGDSTGGGGGPFPSSTSNPSYNPTTDPSNPDNHGGIAISPVLESDNPTDEEPNQDDCNSLVTEVLDAIETAAESAWTLSTDALGNPTFEYAFIVYRLNGVIQTTNPFTSLDPEVIRRNDFELNLSTIPAGAEIIATYHTHPNSRGLAPSHIDLARFLIDSVLKDNDFNAIMSIIHHDTIKYIINIENEAQAETWLDNQNMKRERRIKKRAKNYYDNNIPINSTNAQHNEVVENMNLNVLGDSNNSGLGLYITNELKCQKIN